MNYYNEHDPKAAAWLRELIAQGHLPPGFVDSRDIQLVQPADLVGYTQCHFFAGIGGWSLALLLAGVPTTTRLWTGSCPCQPFSVAGKGLGKTDPRHLWPQFRRLIRLCRPPVVFGEQVASAAGRIWLSGVCADLEALAYRTAAADLCAAGGTEDCEIGILRGDSPLAWERATLSAPHLRQRLWWCAGRLAEAKDSHRRSQQSERPARRWWHGPAGMRAVSGDCRMGNSPCGEQWRPWEPRPLNGRHEQDRGPSAGSHDLGLAHSDGGDIKRICPQFHEHGFLSEDRDVHGTKRNCERPKNLGGLGHPHRAGLGKQCGSLTIQAEQSPPELRGDSRSGGDCSAWATFDLIPCRDGKARRIESGTFPLVDGLPGRVGLLRGYGNAIVPQRASDFIQAALEAIQETSLSIVVPPLGGPDSPFP